VLQGTPTQVITQLKGAYPNLKYTGQTFGMKLNRIIGTLDNLNISVLSKNSDKGSRHITIFDRTCTPAIDHLLKTSSTS